MVLYIVQAIQMRIYLDSSSSVYEGKHQRKKKKKIQDSDTNWIWLIVISSFRYYALGLVCKIRNAYNITWSVV